MTPAGWFQVDRAGLAEIAKRRGMAFIVTEPIQNAWDEDVTRVEIELAPVPGAAKADLTVRDDSPDGFRDLADSYMMFRASYKLANPEQRGRFNIGEKLLLSVAERARINTTTGSVIFSAKGRTTGRTKTAAGSVLTARLRMTRDELGDALKMAASLIPPAGIVTTVNGTALPARRPLAEGEYTLETEIRGEEGGFRRTRRRTTVRVYETLPGETPHLYEMGIPVDTLECDWHVEVMQKVPLTVDRGAVNYGFQSEVQRKAAEMMASRLTEEQARSGWIGDALEFMYDDDAVREIIKKRFGKAVTYDPSAPESNKLALDAGYKVVHGAELKKFAWDAVRRVGALQPAGRVFDDGRVKTSPDGVPPVPRSQWTPVMQRAADYAGRFAEHVLGHAMRIEFYDDAGLTFAGMCGGGRIGINVAKVDVTDRERFDALLIHECAHDKVSDHLTHDFHRECCRIAARARTLWEVIT